MKMENRKRIQWIDIVKGVGICLMVIGHADGAPPYVKLWIYGFHMPLFFIMAGYVYGMFDEIKFQKLGFKYMLKVKSKAYLRPYFWLFCINLLVQTFLELLRYRSKYEPKRILYYLLAGIYAHDTNMPNCAPLWFLTCLFVSYIFFWVIVRQTKMWKQVLIAIIYLILLSAICKMEKFWWGGGEYNFHGI